MKANEYGINFLMNTDFDLSASTSIVLVVTRPDGTMLNITNPALTVGNVDIITNIGTFLANQYVKYVFVKGDVNQLGVYTARLYYFNTAIPQGLISQVAQFHAAA